MIVPARYDLRVKRGETFNADFKYQVDGTVLSLANATITAQIREEQNRQANVVANFTVTVDGNATPTANVSNNVIRIALANTATANITHAKGYYDVKVVDSSNNSYYYSFGDVSFENTITT